ncbi:MAG: glycosyltransferase family 2 protein [Telluria sp.]
MPSDAVAPPLVSVIVPTYLQAHFVPRALDSLLAQSLPSWEAIVVDDGSPDDTARVLAPFLADPRIRCIRLSSNGGLGHALNTALSHARGELIAYLPSDDVFYRDHLRELSGCLARHPDAVLAYSGLRHHYNRSVPGQLGAWLQLVQCMHRATPLRWTERTELESDDLDRLFWHRLRDTGRFVGTGDVTCEWVDHPRQRHKLMQEPLGGINPFRAHYRVAEPLRFHSSCGNAIDEVAQFGRQRSRPPSPPARDGLTIVLAGELAYNADRVLALEEQGHRLYGLWTGEPAWFNTIGPLPFGHVSDLPRPGWREALAHLRPDVIYAQLNWQAVPFAHQVLMASSGIPFVWHFKEGPFICMEKGSWPQLIDLFRRADGRIYSSPELRDWFDTVIPGLSRSGPSLVLDGDLPKHDWFADRRSPLLSDSDGEVHTVVPGRPIGLHPPTVGELAQTGVHLHFYGDFTQGQWRAWIDKARALAPRHLHLHPNVDQAGWVQEFSQYDAGWLHAFESQNGGELRRANWDDLNYPARIATLAMAGVPMIQRDNDGAVVASQALVQRLGLGVFYRSIEELGAVLRDRARMAALREQVWSQRFEFCFDTHVPRLVEFFRTVIGRGATGPRERA